MLPRCSDVADSGDAAVTSPGRTTFYRTTQATRPKLLRGVEFASMQPPWKHKPVDTKWTPRRQSSFPEAIPDARPIRQANHAVALLRPPGGCVEFSVGGQRPLELHLRPV